MSAVNVSWAAIVKKPDVNQNKSSKMPVSNPQIYEVVKKPLNKEEGKTPLKSLNSSGVIQLSSGSSEQSANLGEIKSRVKAIKSRVEAVQINLNKAIMRSPIDKKLLCDACNELCSIVDQGLGEQLNQCIRELYAIQKNLQNSDYWQMCLETDQLAQQMIQVFALAYFVKENWGLSRQALDPSDKETGLAQFVNQAMEALPAEAILNRTWVFGKESNRICISVSGRPQLETPKQFREFSRTQELWKKAFPNNEVVFSAIPVRPTSTQILYKIASRYIHDCRFFQETEYVTHFTKYDKIRGDFCKLLVDLLRERSNLQDRKKVLDEVRSFFPESLSLDMYKKLSNLIPKPEIRHEDGHKIFCSRKINREEAVSMALATIFCGELRMVLEYCRELSSLSREDKDRLPQTLGERLLIVAFQKNEETKKIEQKEICLKCHEMWPVYEAFYYALKKTGLDLGAIEKLNYRTLLSNPQQS